MKRILLTLLLASLPLWAAEKPRAILLFYVDDLGYNDTSVTGCTEVPCPNLNRLAHEGLTFTDAHSTAAVCTPSRYSLFTGQYAWRRKGTHILPGDAKLILPIKGEELTLPAMMQRAGYRTAAIGKWHLGLGRGEAPIDWNQQITPSPREVGFDFSFIMAATGDRVPCVYVRNGKVDGLDPADPISVSYQPGTRYPGEYLGHEHPEMLKPWGRSADKQHDKTIVDGISRIGYMTGGRAARWKDQDIADRLTEEAIGFISRQAGQPIFVYFGTNDIHVPRDPHPRFRGKSKLGIRGDATVQMDDCLGRLRQALADNGYAPEETLIIFSSDNGPVIGDGYLDGSVEACRNHRAAAPYSGGKYRLQEGGTRVPFIVWWPGRVSPGQSNALMCQVDLGRTLAALVGQDIPQGSMPDSQNHLPALLGDTQEARSELVTQAFNASQLALRSGQLKLITGKQAQLYNLSTDPGEQQNLATQQPEVVNQLLRKLEAIRTQQGGNPGIR